MVKSFGKREGRGMFQRWYIMSERLTGKSIIKLAYCQFFFWVLF